MADWYGGLSALQQGLLLIAVFATVIFAIQTALTLTGLGGDEFDAEIEGDVEAMDFGDIFTIRNGVSFLMGFGWGGMIPLQEVIWARFFGRRYLGAVRSAALPLSLLFTAGSPLATSYYFDVVGNYDGAIIAVGISNLVAAALILSIPNPRVS